MKIQTFLTELKRRKVYRVAAVYAAVGVAISIAVPDLFGAFGFPSWAAPLVIVVIVIGFPIALVLAWAYEVKPEEPRPAPEAGIDTPESEQRKSIVVLPFDNMSPDPGDAYFADGLTEEIITSLSHIRSLKVISRSSAMVWKGMQKDVRTIGRELDVQFVLEGSVRKAGDDLRITAQLIDAASDEHLWAEKYDGVLEDVFGMQEQVSGSIVTAMELRLQPGEKRRLTERPIENVQAYDHLLRARFAIESWTEAGFDRALQHLRDGLSLVGEDPLLYAGIAYAHWSRANVGIGGEEEVDLAEQYARKALELDPDCAEAHHVLGVVFRDFRGDQRQAYQHLNRSLAINPNDSHVVLQYAWMTSFIVGRPELSHPHVERLLHLDPLNPLTRWLPEGIELAAGQFARYAKIAWDEWPPMPPFFWYRTLALVYTQQLDEARNVIRKWVEYGWKDMIGSFHAFIEAAIEQNKEHMEAHLTGDRATTGRRDPEWSYWIAGLCAFAGEAEAAFEWVANAVDRGFINYPLLAEHDPFLVRLRGDPRYDALLERVKQEWEEFEV